MRVPFLDLAPVHGPLRDELADAFERVVRSSWYVLGPEVEAFEAEFAEFCEAAHCVGVGNGMEAIALILAALGVGPGDEVATVSLTAFPTAAAITAVGATPVFVDADPATQCMSPEALAGALGPRTRAVLPVHLYGRCADMQAIGEIAADAGIPLVEDAAQAHGARHGGRPAGTLGLAAAFSFYPTKNLGALGDGGAVVTDDERLAERVRRLRNYGETSKYVNAEPGRNSRLDELQAAFLRVKLPHLARWNAERRELAAAYDELLRDSAVTTPPPDPGHVYHLYVVRSRSRDALRAHLASAGVASQVHYPTPVHRQDAYRSGARPGSSLASTEALAGEVLSLPAYPGLDRARLVATADAIRTFAEPSAN